MEEQDRQVFDQIQNVDLQKTMESSYIDYAMSVIVSRALPDVRDGLKPVQRRILHSMVELNNTPDKPHRKCARIVGDTMGKYHPHGDSSIYGALVNMAQEWSTRYPLVDGHGNFGSVDGDSAAAMRYTEARLSKISMELLADIGKNTVDFVPNFDDTEKEPSVLPSRYPNLLVNGTQGIAVGMATNIPPHNLREVVAAVDKMITNRIEENRDTDIEEILELVKAPDFPTGGVIMGTRGAEEAYRTGRGKVRVRGVTDIETLSNGKSQIIISELPYMVNKATLQEKIADLVKLKKIDGITDIRDESNREGMRVVIELRRDANANVILNQLYKHTQLQDTFGVILLALVNNEPKVLNLLQLLTCYLDHQKEVVTRRTKYDLEKAEERDHILQGLLKALDIIDEVIHTIRASADGPEARINLVEKFGFTEKQAAAIVEMRLRALTGLEREKLLEEHEELLKKIAEWKAILADEKLLLGVIRTEINLIADKYGDDRRSRIGVDVYDIDAEDLIPRENQIVAMTNLGYIKRMTMDNFKTQRRGGKGIRGMSTLDEDFMTDILAANTHDYLLFFTSLGRVYRIKAYTIPEASRTSRGTAIVNLLQLMPEEKITAMITMHDYDQDCYLFMATKLGLIKKTSIREFNSVLKAGKIAISLREGDELIDVKITREGSEIFLFTKNAMSIRFMESDIRATGRGSMGNKGIRLKEEDEVIAMQTAEDGEGLLFVTERGFGKRTVLSHFRKQTRGGMGLRCYKLLEKTGNLVAVKGVNEDDYILLVNTEGIVIQLRVEDIREYSRAASGVKLVSLPEGVNVVKIAKLDKEDVVEGASAEIDGEELENEEGFDEDETGEEGTEETAE